MPPALVGGAIALVGKIAAAKTFAIGFAVAFKTFAVGTALTFAYSELMRTFTKKPSRPSPSTAGGVAGSTRGLTGSVIPKRWIVGRARVNGGLIWFREDDNHLYFVTAISAGSCDGIERVWAHGEEVEMVRNGNVLMPVPDSKYWGTREESYTETYTERVPVGSGGDGRDTGPTPGGGRPSGRDPSSCFQGQDQLGDPLGDSRGEGACGGCGGTHSGGRGDPSSCFVSAGGGPVYSESVRSLPMFGHWWNEDIPLKDLLRWNPAASGTTGTAASAGAAAGDGVSGQQGEGGGNRPGEDGGRSAQARRPSRASGYTVVTRTRTRTREVRVPLIKVTEYFRADGSEGAEIRALAAGAGEGELPWTDAHRLDGISYALVELYQPDYTEIDDRFWPGIPRMEFLVRGIKISYPVADATAPNGRRVTEPAWTRNAAIIRYWYLTERRNIDPLLIDLEYFEAARGVCEEELQLTDESGYQSDYPETVKRYTIDGSITSGDSASAVDAQLDFAWQGFVVESSGSLLFRPGTDLASRFAITEDDIIADPVVRPFGRRSDLANELSLSLEQSSGSDYLAEEFTITDAAAQQSDGERLPQELAQMKFVTEPVQAVNMLTQRLRQQRGLVTMDLLVKSPPDWRYLTLVAGDKITVQLPEFGIGVDGARLRDFRVTGVQVNDDYSVALNLLEWPDGLFQDRFDFPPRQQKFSYTVRAVPAPVGQGAIDWNINRDGQVVWTAFLSWDSTPYETAVDVVGDLSTAQSKRTRNNSVSFDLTQSDVYTFNLRHINRSGISSAQSQVVLAATYDDIPLPKPQILSAEQNGNLVVIRVRNVPDRDIDGMEVRYRSRGLDASFTDIPVITEADWNEAPQMSVSPAVPPNADDPIFGYAVLPASGTYRIYVRLRNRVGNLSPLSDVRDERYEIRAATTGSVTSQPQWSGRQTNLILWPHDGDARLITDRAGNVDSYDYSVWDGDSDFPFGQHVGYGRALGTQGRVTGKTIYTTERHNFLTPEGTPDRKRREVYVALEAVAPDGKLATDPQGFEITLQYWQGGFRNTRVVADGEIVNLENLDGVQAFVNFYNQRNHALVAVTIGWREID